MAGRSRGRGRWLAMQVVVSIGAAACVAALFPSGQGPQGTVPPVESGKSVQRVKDGAGQAILLRYDSPEQAALASMARFTPTASPVVAVPAAVRAPAKIVTVLPPPRPLLEVSTPAMPAAEPQPAARPEEGWRIAGMEVPGSARVRRYVPSGDDLVRTGSAAWNAGANVVRKVATLGGLL